MIDDGYTFDIRTESGLVSVRPMSTSERRKYFDWLRKSPDRTHAARKILGHYLVDDINTVGDYDALWEQGDLAALQSLHQHIVRSDAEDRAEVANLISGARLMLQRPELARRSCTDCQKWWYRSDGSIKHGQASGRPLLRPPHTEPVCRTSIGCPKGTPENSRAFSERNLKAWLHYREYRAVGCEADGIVRRNWRVLDDVFRWHMVLPLMQAMEARHGR